MDRMGCISGRILLCLLIIFSDSPTCLCWGWFSSSAETNTRSHENTAYSYSPSYRSNSEFSMEVFSDKKAVRALENAKTKLVGAPTCWQNAYGYLFSGCKDIVATEEKRKRFAWHLSDCFLKDSGRRAFPTCNEKSTMVNCIKKLDDHEHKIYLEFLLETNTICYQLQSHAFKNDIERLVNELRRSAEDTEDKLEILDKKSDVLIERSSRIHESLGSIDHQVQSMAQMTSTLDAHMDGLSQHTNEIYQEAKNIADSQLVLREGQEKMGETLKDGMDMLSDAYRNLGEGIDKLKSETNEIEGEISKLGTSMSSKMNDLQSKADDIGSMTGSSLDKQQELLDGQSTALEGLQFLTRFQSEALQESRDTLERLVDYSQKQQQELVQRQEQLQQVHDHLFENSKSILAAQEAFEAKQASMFIALDKLFALHNAMLLESRLIKACFIYFMSMFIIYMFTSTKQTYTIRPRLYIGLCITLALEVVILRFVIDAEQQAWMTNLVRSIFVVLASAQILYAVFTYRDYEVLNHQILLRLVEKLNNMQSNKDLSWDEETDSEVEWSTWIDADLSDDEDNLRDPDYKIPEVMDNSISTCSATRKLYSLRPR